MMTCPWDLRAKLASCSANVSDVLSVVRPCGVSVLMLKEEKVSSLLFYIWQVLFIERVGLLTRECVN